MNKVQLKQYVSTAREKCVGDDIRIEAFRASDLPNGSYVDICMSSVDGQGIRRYHKFVFRSCDLFSDDDCIKVEFDINPDEFIYKG